jgi:SulP family sulfate permease
MLMVLAGKEKAVSPDGNTSPTIPIPENTPDLSDSQLDGLVGSPRRDLLYQAATTTITETPAPEQRRWQNFNQPLPLLLQAFSELTTQNESFWFRAVPYFVKRQFTKGQMLYARGDRPDGFYLLQSGILRCEYYLEQGNYHESIVAGTTCGELPFFSETERTSSVIAELDCVAWLLTTEKWEELQEKDGDVARELLKVGMKLSAERMNAITSYVLVTAS